MRLKAFDYGVISVALTRPIPQQWDDLLADAIALYDNARLAEAAEQACRTLLTRIARLQQRATKAAAVPTPRAPRRSPRAILSASTDLSAAVLH